LNPRATRSASWSLADSPSAAHCRPRRHRLTATAYRQQRDDDFATWCEITNVAVAA